MEAPLNIKVIGVGGIGSILSGFLARYLAYDSLPEKPKITLIDKDEFEEKNAARQIFDQYGPKAQVKAEELAKQFECLSMRAISEWVTEDNVDRLICEGDLVFLCVDNHKTRKLVSDRCGRLKNVVLISGGNELTDGNVQIYIRRDGQDVTESLTKYNPEIANPLDKSPSEMSCDELKNSGQPQLLFMNLDVVSKMLNAFYAWLKEVAWTKEKPGYSEVYLDILQNKASPITRGGQDANEFDRQE